MTWGGCTYIITTEDTGNVKNVLYYFATIFVLSKSKVSFPLYRYFLRLYQALVPFELHKQSAALYWLVSAREGRKLTDDKKVLRKDRPGSIN
jgi:hypothetical protein